MASAPRSRRRRAQDERDRRVWPTARISCTLPLLERPSIASRAASRRSSVTVIAPAPLPVPFEAPRLRSAALAPSRPSAERVCLESFEMVCFSRAPAWAFLTFLRAVSRCFCVANAPHSLVVVDPLPRATTRDAHRRMATVSEDDIIHLVGGMPGAVVVTTSEANGAPAVAWGDSFFFYDPDDRAEDRRLPFATIVTKDYAGFDTASELSRPGVFRLNIADEQARRVRRLLLGKGAVVAHRFDQPVERESRLGLLLLDEGNSLQRLASPAAPNSFRIYGTPDRSSARFSR